MKILQWIIVFVTLTISSKVVHGQEYDGNTDDVIEYKDESSMSNNEETATILNMVPPRPAKPNKTAQASTFDRPLYNSPSLQYPADEIEGKPDKSVHGKTNKNRPHGNNKDKFENNRKHPNGDKLIGKNKPGNEFARNGRGMNDQERRKGIERKGNQKDNVNKPNKNKGRGENNENQPRSGPHGKPNINAQGKPPVKDRDNDRFINRSPSQGKGNGNQSNRSNKNNNNKSNRPDNDNNRRGLDNENQSDDYS